MPRAAAPTDRRRSVQSWSRGPGLSKSCALAGLRVGYALGDAGLIEALRRVKDSFNSHPLGRLAQAGATASVRDEAHFRESCARVVAGREAMTRELIRLGFA